MNAMLACSARLLLSTMLFASGILIPAHAQREFSRDLTKCATAYDMSISGSTSRSIDELIAGSAQLDLNSFINLFPASDRLAAYRIFDQCLARRYKTQNNGRAIDTGARVAPLESNFPDITNKSLDVSASLDVNGKKEHKIPFSVSGRCDLVIKFGRGMGFNHAFVVSTRTGSRVASSFLGTNHSPKRVIVGQGDYFFSLLARDGAGYYEARIEALCS